MDDTSRFGAEVRRLIRRCGQTVTQVASGSGVDRAGLQRFLAGNALTSMSLGKVLDYLGYTLTEVSRTNLPTREEPPQVSLQEPPAVVAPQEPPAVVAPQPEVRPRRPHNWFAVPEPPPGSETPYEEDDVEDIGDYGEEAYDRTIRDIEDRKKVTSNEEKVATWTEQKKEYINPILFHIINSPPSPEYKVTTLSFVLSLVPAARLALFGRLATLLDDTHADLGKLDWVVGMGEAGARKIGRQLSRLRRESDIEDFDKEAVQIFQSPESLRAWVEGLTE